MFSRVPGNAQGRNNSPAEAPAQTAGTKRSNRSMARGGSASGVRPTMGGGEASIAKAWRKFSPDARSPALLEEAKICGNARAGLATPWLARASDPGFGRVARVARIDVEHAGHDAALKLQSLDPPYWIDREKAATASYTGRGRERRRAGASSGDSRTDRRPSYSGMTGFAVRKRRETRSCRRLLAPNARRDERHRLIALLARAYDRRAVRRRRTASGSCSPTVTAMRR